MAFKSVEGHWLAAGAKAMAEEAIIAATTAENFIMVESTEWILGKHGARNLYMNLVAKQATTWANLFNINMADVQGA
jgi:hypothetical protein